MEPEYIISQKERLARTTHLYIYEDNYAVTDEDKRYTSRYDDKTSDIILENINDNCQWTGSDTFKVKAHINRPENSYFINPIKYYFFRLRQDGIELLNRKPTAFTYHYTAQSLTCHYTGRFGFNSQSTTTRYNGVRHI